MKKIINTKNAPAALGPYSQAIEANGVYDKYLGEVKPARACVEVARLPKDVKVEIGVIAVK